MDNLEILLLFISIFGLVICIIGYAMIREMNENIKILDEEIQNIKAKNEIIDPILIRLDLLKQIDEKFKVKNEPEIFIDGVKILNRKPCECAETQNKKVKT